MMEFLRQVTRRTFENFDPDVVGDQMSAFLANVAVALLTLLVFVVAWWVVRAALKPTLSRSGLDTTAQSFVLTLVMYAILILGVVAALSEMGVATASLATSLGVVGLTVGFAARDSLSNVISGIFIFWDRPFVIGDLVEIHDHYGRVDRITMRSTRVVTPDGKMLAVPNTEMVNSIVASYTNFPNLRLDVRIELDGREDVDRLRRMLLALVAEDDAFLSDPPPRVVITGIEGPTMIVELQAWLRDERDHVRERSRIRERVLAVLRQAEIPLSTQTVELLPVEVRGTLDRPDAPS